MSPNPNRSPSVNPSLGAQSAFGFMGLETMGEVQNATPHMSFLQPGTFVDSPSSERSGLLPQNTGPENAESFPWELIGLNLEEPLPHPDMVAEMWGCQRFQLSSLY